MGIGTAINVLAVLAGGSIGTLAGARLPEGMRSTAMQAIGIVTLLVGGEPAVAALTYARAADTLVFVGGTKAQRPCGCPRGRKERLVEGNDKQWRGSPLDAAGSGMDAYGIKEIVFEFDNGDEDVFTPKQREEFESYELHQMATYLDSIGHSIRKGKKN